MNILFVEDDPLIQGGVEDFLTREGYRVFSAVDGEEGLALFRQNTVHLAVLDVMLPKLDGIGLLREIRKASQVPALMLTALTDEGTQIRSFDELADDYICKPFSLVILKKRIEALLRRHYGGQRFWRHGAAEVDLAGFSATYDGEDAQLTPKEIRLLALLLEYSGQVLSREQMLDAVWESGDGPFERIIDTYIKNLRKKLHLGCIVTVKGIGYKIEP